MEFPKPLPELVYKNFELETGFYQTEVVALQNGWSLIKRSFLSHSTKISVNFFSKHFWLLERFRELETKKINLSTLHQHTYQIMTIYGQLIESGLNDVTFINIVLGEMKNDHKLCGISPDDVKLIIDYIEQYLLEFLHKVKSTTFQNGLNKLNELIIGHCKESSEGGGLTNEQDNCQRDVCNA